MRIGQGITLTVKNTRKAAAVLKREEIKNTDIHRSALAPSTLIPNLITSGKGVETNGNTHREACQNNHCGKCAAADRYINICSSWKIANHLNNDATLVTK